MSIISTLQTYRDLEQRIRSTDLDALLARWEFGRALLVERGGNRRLPNGKLEELASALAISRSEIKNRMQFAQQYADEGQLANVVSQFGSWHEIVRLGLGERRGRPAPVIGNAIEGLEGEVEEAFRVPATLWKGLREVTDAAYAAGISLGNNHPGVHGVGALLALYNSEAGQAAWGRLVASRQPLTEAA